MKRLLPLLLALSCAPPPDPKIDTIQQAEGLLDNGYVWVHTSFGFQFDRQWDYVVETGSLDARTGVALLAPDGSPQIPDPSVSKLKCTKIRLHITFLYENPPYLTAWHSGDTFSDIDLSPQSLSFSTVPGANNPPRQTLTGCHYDTTFWLPAMRVFRMVVMPQPGTVQCPTTQANWVAIANSWRIRDMATSWLAYPGSHGDIEMPLTGGISGNSDWYGPYYNKTQWRNITQACGLDTSGYGTKNMLAYQLLSGPPPVSIYNYSTTWNN